MVQLARLGHAHHVPLDTGGVLRLRSGRQSALENRPQGQHDSVSLRRAVPADAEDVSGHDQRGVCLRPGEQGAAGEGAGASLSRDPLSECPVLVSAFWAETGRGF